MSDTSTKKPWSKKKKILVITLSIVAVLLVAIIGGGAYALNWYCTPVDYEIQSAQTISNTDTRIIAHRGFRAVAPENTLPAFEKAGESHFWGAECDVYRTKDGVWVIHHDFITYRMNKKLQTIRGNTYEDLMKPDTTNGNHIDQYPNLKICTFEEYIKACEQYGMSAIIELKSKHDTEYYSEIIDILSKYDVDYAFISFIEEDIVAMRQLSDAPMFFLTDVVTDEAIEFAKSVDNCGIDFNAYKEENYENDSAQLKKCSEEGLVLGAWTVDDLETMEMLTDLGVNYITTDCITY